MSAAPDEFFPSHILAWSEALANGAVESGPRLALWRPKGASVALGLSQNAEREMEVDACRRDGVALVRRQSGGGAVLLCQGVLCWEAWASQRQIRDGEGDSGIRQGYAFCSRPVVDGLRRLGLDVRRAGICDLSMPASDGAESRKIAGTAQLRRREQVLVHGSLLVNPDIGELGRYLRFPGNQPDYRRGRSHRDFCATVAECLGRSGRDGDLMADVAAAIRAAASDAGWNVLEPPTALPADAFLLERDKYLSDAWNWSRVRPHGGLLENRHEKDG